MGSQPVQPSSVLRPSRLRGKEGFTLPKILVVIVILGVFTGSALPAYQIYQQMAYSSEASLMLAQILYSQSVHFRQYHRFSPNHGQGMFIFHGDPSSEDESRALENALGINIPGDDQFDYYIQAFPGTGDAFSMAMVSAGFPLFTDGTSQLIGLLDKDGRLSVSSEPLLTEDTVTNNEQKNTNNKKETP